MTGITALAPYIEATAMGLGLGLEREWSNRGGEQQAAGSRTFAVLGLAGAVAASFGGTVVAAGALAVGVLLAAGYMRTAKADRGTTTEVAALATYLLGALVLSQAQLAIGMAVVIAVLLAAKGPIHRLAREVVSETEVQDALRFFVIAFVVLPLVPDRGVGPYSAINPSTIWLLVVALTGIGWAGYIAVRALGPRRGLLITGFAGGFISATATTANLARLARTSPSRRPAALGGALLASTATLIQLAVVTAIANPALLESLAPGLVGGLAVAGAEVALIYRRSSSEEVTARQLDESVPRSRPFALWPALALAGALTLVVLSARWGSALLGSRGAELVGTITGFADAHAPVLGVASLAASGSLSLQTALTASGLALATNTISKCALAFAVGGVGFGARFALLLLAPATVFLLGLLLALR